MGTRLLEFGEIRLMINQSVVPVGLVINQSVVPVVGAGPTGYPARKGDDLV